MYLPQVQSTFRSKSPLGAKYNGWGYIADVTAGNAPFLKLERPQTLTVTVIKRKILTVAGPGPFQRAFKCEV